MPPLYWPDQKDLSTKEEVSPARARIPAPDEQPGRSASAPQPAAQRARAPSLKRRTRLRRRADFKSAIDGRRFHSGRALVGFAVPGSTAETRVGITVSRQIDASVDRNRARRRVREAARESMLGADSPLRRVGIRYDVVLIARPPALQIAFADLKAEASLAALRLVEMRPSTKTTTP